MAGSPNGSLKGKTVLVVGRGSGLAGAIALAALDAGAHVVAADRNQETLPAAYAGEPGIVTEVVDLTDEASIAALGERLGSVDHVISTASARARGRLADLDRNAIRLSFDTKVIGPLVLAKHPVPGTHSASGAKRTTSPTSAPAIRPGGSAPPRTSPRASCSP